MKVLFVCYDRMRQRGLFDQNKKIMKLILLLLSVFLYFNAYPQAVISYIQFAGVDSINNVEYDPAVLFFKYQPPKDSNFTGVDTIYSSTANGDKITICNYYKNGEEYKIVGYYDNGNKYREETHRNGLIYGFKKEWYKTGQLKEIIFYMNGKDTITGIFFKENGDIDFLSCGNTTYEFYNGFLTGKIVSTDSGVTSLRYDTLGNLYWIITENGGIKENKFYYPNYPKRQLQVYGHIDNVMFLEVGKWQEWYKNGQLKAEYYFNDSIPNQREGTWRWWDEQGNLIREEQYKNGQLISSKELKPKQRK